jgi:hypothetical protein
MFDVPELRTGGSPVTTFAEADLVEAFSLLLGRDVQAAQGKHTVLYSSGTMDPDDVIEMFEGRRCRVVWQFVEGDGRIVEEDPNDVDASWLVEIMTDGSLFDAMLVATHTWDARAVKAINEMEGPYGGHEGEVEDSWRPVLQKITNDELREYLQYFFVTEEEARCYGTWNSPDLPLNDIPGREYVMGWESNEGTEDLAILHEG